MPKSNRTISGWLGQMGGRSMESGYAGSVVDHLDNDCQTDYQLDRVTLTDGWEYRRVMLPFGGGHGREFHRSHVIPGPILPFNHLSMDVHASGYRGKWFSGSGFSNSLERSRALSETDASVDVDCLLLGTSLRAERGKNYHVRLNCGLIILTGHTTVVVDENRGLICVDNCHNSLCIDNNCGKILRRDDDNPVLICVQCLQSVSSCRHAS